MISCVIINKHNIHKLCINRLIVNQNHLKWIVNEMKIKLFPLLRKLTRNFPANFLNPNESGKLSEYKRFSPILGFEIYAREFLFKSWITLIKVVIKLVELDTKLGIRASELLCMCLKYTSRLDIIEVRFR